MIAISLGEVDLGGALIYFFLSRETETHMRETNFLDHEAWSSALFNLLLFLLPLLFDFLLPLPFPLPLSATNIPQYSFINQ